MRRNFYALGRLRSGQMNRTEQAYARHLESQRTSGEVLWWKFEGIKLRLADKTFFTADFAVLNKNLQFECHEVKGFMMDDANVKLKVAAQDYPFIFKLIRLVKGGWDIREI